MFVVESARLGIEIEADLGLSTPGDRSLFRLRVERCGWGRKFLGAGSGGKPADRGEHDGDCQPPDSAPGRVVDRLGPLLPGHDDALNFSSRVGKPCGIEAEFNFKGHLTTSKYAKLARCSNDTALRDIRELLHHGILVKNPGGGRSTSYRLANPGEVPA